MSDKPVSVSPVVPDDFVRPEPAQAGIVPPYTTPIPTAHDGSTGWVWCATCESPQPVSGHDCVPVRCLKCGKPEWEGTWVCACDSLDAELSRAEMRAEFAESVLFGAMWDHEIRPFGHAYVPECAFCVLRGPK